MGSSPNPHYLYSCVRKKHSPDPFFSSTMLARVALHCTAGAEVQTSRQVRRYSYVIMMLYVTLTFAVHVHDRRNKTR